MKMEGDNPALDLLGVFIVVVILVFFVCQYFGF